MKREHTSNDDWRNSPGLRDLSKYSVVYKCMIHVFQQPLRGKLTRELGQDMQDNNRKDETNGQEKNNQRINSQTLSFISEQLQHQSRRSARAGGSSGQRCLGGILRLLVGGVFSLCNASQSSGSSRLKLVTIIVKEPFLWLTIPFCWLTESTRR